MTNKDSRNKNKTWTIYRHINKTNGFSYIGQTSFRLSKYRWGTAGHGYQTQPAFWSAIREFGWENFEHEILETGITSLKEANLREQYWIGYYHTWIGDPECKGYNTMRGGGNNWYIASEETREKMRQAKLGKAHTDEYNEMLSQIEGGRRIICVETGEEYYSFGDVERKTKIRHVSEVCHHEREIAGGYHWAFIDDLDWQNKFKQFIGKPRNITKKAKRKVLCVETGEEFESIAAAKLVHNGCITKALSGERELAAGYHWRYIDDND